MQLPILLPQLRGLQSAAACRCDVHMGSMVCSCPPLCPTLEASWRAMASLCFEGAVAGSIIVPLDLLQVQTLQLTTTKSADRRMTCSCSSVCLSR